MTKSIDDISMVEICKALSNPHRLSILRILHDTGPITHRQLVDQMPIVQSTVSQHVNVLVEAGLVDRRTDGPRAFLTVNDERLASLISLVEIFFNKESEDD